MISLAYPKGIAGRYFSFFDSLIGPCDISGSPEYDIIVRRSSYDFITEGKGIYHENNVINQQIDGSVKYCPIYDIGTPVPTLRYPRQTTFRYTNSLGSPGTVTLSGGYLAAGECRTTAIPYSTSKNYVHSGFTGLQLIKASNKVDSPLLGSWDRYTIQNMVWSSTKVNITYKKESFNKATVGVETGHDWRTTPSLADLIAAIALFPATATTSSTISVTWFPYIGYAKNPDELIRFVESLLNSKPISDPYLEIAHWGDLAQEASSKTVANHVNMIAFLRDLRDPTALIPKLRNLSKLKTWASNYLAFQYGILPTISDLQNIRESLQKVAPYIDSNGYGTYGASRYFSSKNLNDSYTTEQHLKLAICSEDDFFDDVIEKIEATGFLPTLENIWDLIPYSFAIDWFVGIGDLLQRIDGRQRLARLNIRYVTMSLKHTLCVDFDPKVNRLTGNISQVHYHRWTTDQCPVPPLSLQQNSQGFDHWLEAGALILQRAK